MTTGAAGNGPLGLVVSGAAARGPYEAGAIAEVMRRLPPDRPLVLLGTSSGAITVALLAQFAASGTSSGERVADVWRRVHAVYTNPVRTLPRTGAVLAGRALGLPVGRVSSVLDVGPLRAVADAEFDAAAVHAVVGGPRIRALGVAATVVPPRGAAARTRLFVAGEQPTGDPCTPPTSSRPASRSSTSWRPRRSPRSSRPCASTRRGWPAGTSTAGSASTRPCRRRCASASANCWWSPGTP